MKQIHWSPSSFGIEEVEPEIEEVFHKYKYALDYIGIDFENSSIQQAILECYFGLEEAFQSTISYWIFKTNNQKEVENPNTFLVKAITEGWRPYSWKEEWLENFQTFPQYWWRKAGKILGVELRDRLFDEVAETQLGEPYISFASGKRLYFYALDGWTWERFIDYLLKLIQDREDRELQIKLLECRSKTSILQTSVEK